jgi:alpha-amylase
VGQFDHISEHSTHVSYLPLIEALERYPRIKVAMHYSGTLLDWLKQHHVEIIGRLRALVARGQIEMLSGGYYEPVLAVLPDEDKSGQIEKLNAELQTTLSGKATGLWLAERIWEPHLARPIAEAGLRYVIVDDTAFENVGFDREKDLFGYFITEEQGHTLAVFPTLTYLRYAIPWEPVETLLEWLRERAVQPESGFPPRLALMGDDGEKFGTWPGTYEHCWGDGKYIEELFTALEMNGEWLKTITPGAYMARYPALGRAYLPAVSYMEMGAWSLLPDDSAKLSHLRRKMEREKRPDIARFLRGGLWRNFMVKYDEINHLHKRMLMVSNKVHAMRRGRKRDRALELLWAAQGNDPYWHGLFGGIYLFNIRVATYANLIAAEDAAEGEELTASLTRQDFNCDGHEDVIVSSVPFNAIWAPAFGGSLLELDFRPAQYNLYDIMTRRKEGYHSELVRAANENAVITPMSPQAGEVEGRRVRVVRAKEPGLELRLIYDWHRRASFLDHFLGPSASLDEFFHAQYAEQGDFVNQPYQIIETNCTNLEANVRLRRNGHVWIGEIHRPVNIEKTFTVRYGDPAIRVRYALSQPSDMAIDLRFGIETVIGFDGGHDLRYCSLHVNDGSERMYLNGIREFEAVTRHSADTNLQNLTLSTELSKPAFLWQFPLETITLSEAGFERGYQGTVFLHVWHIHLAPGEQWEVSITQSVQQTATRP